MNVDYLDPRFTHSPCAKKVLLSNEIPTGNYSAGRSFSGGILSLNRAMGGERNRLDRLWLRQYCTATLKEEEEMKTKREFLKFTALAAGAGLLQPWKWGARPASAAGPEIKVELPSVQSLTGQAPKKYVVVDAQFHHVPTAVFKKVDESTFTSKEGKELQEKNRLPRTQNSRATKLIQDLEAALRHMDTCGTDVAMIQMPSWSVAGMEVCKVLNDGLAKAGQQNPKRFLPLATCPYIFGQESIDELTRVKNELGFKGIAILTNQQGIRLDDEKLKPYFKKVVEIGLPVVVHPPTQEKGLWGGTKYDMDSSVSREYEIIKSFTEVINGVLPEFPELNFVFAHFGGGVPSLLGRIMSWYTPPKQAGLPHKELEYPLTIAEFEEAGFKPYFDKILDRVYFDMAGTGGWMTEVTHALAVIKPDRLNFGSDYPHEMSRTQDTKAYIEGIKSLKISDDDKAKLLGGNMVGLFKFQA
jgi:predicted TIM-barrel fold metal-dependent hydrolase